jgi:hypothetical protein
MERRSFRTHENRTVVLNRQASASHVVHWTGKHEISIEENVLYAAEIYAYNYEEMKN